MVLFLIKSLNSKKNLNHFLVVSRLFSTSLNHLSLSLIFCGDLVFWSKSNCNFWVKPGSITKDREEWRMIVTDYNR